MNSYKKHFYTQINKKKKEYEALDILEHEHKLRQKLLTHRKHADYISQKKKIEEELDKNIILKRGIDPTILKERLKKIQEEIDKL
jgi:ATP-dependent Lon protease